jgi:hypothetical protein
MPLPKYIVRLTAEERAQLKELIRTGKRAASVLTHARILLKADVGAGGPGWGDGRIGEAVACSARSACTPHTFNCTHVDAVPVNVQTDI